MSRNSQTRSTPLVRLPAEFGALAVGSIEMRFGQRFATHRHAEHQLVWCESGVLAVTLDARTWVLPPTRALWVPGGTPHAVQASSPATMRSLYFRQRSSPVRWKSPTAVAVSPLLRELICHLARDSSKSQALVHARRLLGSLLLPLQTARIDLPLPKDARARRVTQMLTERVADARSLAQLGKAAGASARTLARIFSAETGMTFGQWRTQLRIRSALAYLAEGASVSEVAGRVGYESTSAFVAAFRRRVGVPPGAYFQSQSAG